MKIRSPSEFQSRLDEEFSWRVLEINAARKTVQTAENGVAQNAILRASVALIYAHWEGFVKLSSSYLSLFLCSSGLKYQDLRKSLWGLRAKYHVDQIQDLRKSVFATSEVLDAIFMISDSKYADKILRYIDDVGNLNYDLFEQILRYFGISVSGYETKKQLIDERLLKNRNGIAHGNFVIITVSDFETLSSEVLALMRQFKDDLENYVTLTSYKLSPATRSSVLNAKAVARR